MVPNRASRPCLYRRWRSCRRGETRMTPTKLLIGQILCAGDLAARRLGGMQWAASMLACQPQLGSAWFRLGISLGGADRQASV